MNQSDFAKSHGVSRKTVTVWKDRGWLVFKGDELDVEASNENLRKYRREVVTQPPQKNKVTDLGNIRATNSKVKKIVVWKVCSTWAHLHGSMTYPAGYGITKRNTFCGFVFSSF